MLFRIPIFFAFFFVLVSLQNAYAYLDPGTGSYLLQILLASLLGAIFSIKIYWVKIKSFVRNMFGKKNDGEQ
jgi:hypothetical protein